MLSHRALYCQHGRLAQAKRFLHSLPPSAGTRPSRLRKLGRFLIYTSIGVGAIYTYDITLNATAIGRNVRTLYTGAFIAADYKINFNAANSESIPALQERVAERLYNLIISNGGLYIKIGQAIGANAAILPEPFRKRFGKLFDDAPTVPYTVIEEVIKKAYGVERVEDVFAEFDKEPVASASVAQVHRARLKDGGGEDGKGTWVAVKVQKPAVTKQVNWDLAAYKILMWCYDKVFPMPIYFLADFIASHLRQELDFANEASNAIRTASYINSPEYASLDLKGRVYVPRVYEDLTTKRVMVAEWIDGVRMSDRALINVLVGDKVPHQRAWEIVKGDMTGNWDGAGESKEARYWREHDIPVKGGKKAIMKSMIDLFCAQMFVFGFIHCDPHPGNVIIRRLPGTNEPQLVLLDHGLYVQMSPNFRRQYANLWRSLLTLDWETIKEVGAEWGIGSPEMFASATLMRPVRIEKEGGGEVERPKMTQYEVAEKMKENLKKFLTDTDLMPKELVFIGRNMRIVQANNQSLGSPVNRIRITAQWASKSLTLSHSSSTIAISQSRDTFLRSFSYRISATYRHFLFLTLLLGMDITFYLSKIRQWIRGSEEGWEEEIERGMRGWARENVGLEIEEDAFQG